MLFIAQHYRQLKKMTFKLKGTNYIDAFLIVNLIFFCKKNLIMFDAHTNEVIKENNTIFGSSIKVEYCKKQP